MLYTLFKTVYEYQPTSRALVKIAHGEIKTGGDGRTWVFNGPTKRWRLAKQDTAIALPMIDDEVETLASERFQDYKDSGQYRHMVLKDGLKHGQIAERDGVEAADAALLERSRRWAKQYVQKQKLYEAIALENDTITHSGTPQQKEELAAFTRLHPDSLRSTTLADWKQANPDAASTLVSRYRNELERDRRLSLSSIEARGQELTRSLTGIESLSKSEQMTRMEAFRNSLVQGGYSSAEAAQKVEAIDFQVSTQAASSQNHEVAKEAAQSFFELAGADLPTLSTFKTTKRRAYADRWNKYINMGFSVKPKTIFHEMGHHLECSDSRIAEAAAEWRDARATGEVQPLSELVGLPLYDDNEMAVPGDYIDPYVGKIYKSGDTEVLSVGLEHFTDTRKMLLLWERDRSHFEFVVGVIRA